ncbi:helix-hairpin-helix domain-containing protein [Pendulispora rubella]|uniref:Helix-hairpin-helix domain-containing protein n=1 Tax=Pendulispora rubella TaxID=2741070 RepID=A0ABZ2L1E2_9BACT
MDAPAAPPPSPVAPSTVNIPAASLAAAAPPRNAVRPAPVPATPIIAIPGARVPDGVVGPAPVTSRMGGSPSTPPALDPNAPLAQPDSASVSPFTTLDLGGSFSMQSEFPPSLVSTSQVDPGDVRGLFGELAAQHMQPVRDFMLELTSQPADTSWLEICEPAIRSLRRSAEGMELPDLANALDGYVASLAAAINAGGKVIEGQVREAVLAAYSGLVTVLPEAFTLPEKSSGAQREALIVHAVLRQVPGVTRQAIDKLYGAGLTSLDTLYAAKAEDLSAAAGISREVAERIVAKATAFRTERDRGRDVEREELAFTTALLRKLHEEYERATEEWADSASGSRKRHVRQARAEALLKVEIILARWGAVKLVQELDKQSFERKLEIIERYVKEEAAKIR